VKAERFLIVTVDERGYGDVLLFWKEGAAGYTRYLEEAGRWTLPKAKALVDLKGLCERMIAQDESDWAPPDPKWYLHIRRAPGMARNDRIADLREVLERRKKDVIGARARVAERVAFVKALERMFPRSTRS
jgi:hypothetical protein